MKKPFDPGNSYPGGFTNNDGTVEFYGRINAILPSSPLIIDIGAGRGAWYENDTCQYRKSIRSLKSKAKELIGVDTDAAVMQNRSTTQNLVMKSGRVPLQDEVADVIIADYVLEHVNDPTAFASEVERLMKPGGFFCARTPHRYNYVSLISRLLAEARAKAIVQSAQPNRFEEDIFPTVYKLNTSRDIKKHFVDWDDYSYLHRCDPAYYFSKRAIYKCQSIIHRILPGALSGNLFVFLRKPL